MVFFEKLFQQTLLDTPDIISSMPFPNTFSSLDKNFTIDYLPLLVLLGFIHSVPLHLLQFRSALLTIDLVPKIRSQENQITLKQMFDNSIDKSIMKGTFTTSLYNLALSNLLLIAFPWVVSNCYSFYSYFEGGYIYFGVICCVAIGKLLMVYLEWSAILNMSIVVSFMDGLYGVGALRVSCFLSSGNQKKGGFLLMLVFFVIGLFLRLLSVYFGWYKGGIGVFVQIGILIVVNTIKWVAFVIYFCDCKKSKMEKNLVDEELGKAQLESVEVIPGN